MKDGSTSWQKSLSMADLFQICFQQNGAHFHHRNILSDIVNMFAKLLQLYKQSNVCILKYLISIQILIVHTTESFIITNLTEICDKKNLKNNL